IHEGNRTPTQFDGLGALPDTRALSGIKSQEVGGQGFNQLRLDDSTGQVNAQLASSHAVSQLNLGNLVHPRKAQEGKPRGAGFELRTDQFGALRAGQGLLLSTYEQTQAKADHLQAEQAKSQLEGSFSHASALSEVAKNQQTDPLNGLDGLKSFIESIEQRDEDKATSFKQALMLLASVDSIGLSSQQDIHVSSDAQLNQTAGDSINLSSQK
ncbi:type VI secretion system Vgr family protein, partial [Rhizobium hidalgonense]